MIQSLQKQYNNDFNAVYQLILDAQSKNHYSERNFARVIDSATYERTALADQKLPSTLIEFPVSTKGIFKDSYMFEFIDLPSPTLIAEYETKLIKKSVLEKKLHELAQLLPWEETDGE